MNNEKVFINGISIVLSDKGQWVVSKVKSNFGKFDIGSQENELLDLDALSAFTSYVKSTLEAQIQKFLDEEEEEARRIAENDLTTKED